MGHFTAEITKLRTLFFNLLRQNAVDIQNRRLYIHAPLNPYQENLVTFKLMTSQVEQRHQPKT